MRPVVIAAVHEAGHVVVACALGLQCGGAHVDHDGGGLAATKNPYLLASDLIARGRPRAVRSAFRARMLVAMAGVEATDIVLGECSGDSVDLRNVARMATGSLAAIRDWPATELRMRRATRRLVRRHRRTIGLVANALVQRGALTARQIDALVRASR